VINLLLTSVVVDTNESVSTTHLLSVESHRARRAVGRRRGTKSVSMSNSDANTVAGSGDERPVAYL
jgi:hypothetical protein